MIKKRVGKWLTWLTSNSIQRKIITYAICFIVPIIAFLIASNFYAVKIVRNQVYESNRNTIRLYVNQLDRTFENADTFLSGMGFAQSDLQAMTEETGENERKLAAFRVKNVLSSSLYQYDAIDAFFVSAPLGGEYVYRSKFTEEYQQQKAIDQYILETITNKTKGEDLPKNWYPCKVGEKFYMFRFFSLQGTCFGAWIDVDHLLQNLKTVEMAGLDNILFVSGEGIPLSNEKNLTQEGIDFGGDLGHYYLTGKNDNYMVVGQKSEMGDFRLVALLQDKDILAGLQFFSFLIITLIVISGLLLILFFVFSQKEIAAPLNRLSRAMESIESGNLDTKIPDVKTADEFKMVNRTFNSMTTQIKELKITVYEEKIHKQKAQLDFYKIQVSPHFFINALNTIYSFAQTKNLEMVKQMTMCVVRHFRYTLHSSQEVRLSEELDFTRNFLQMQEIRSAGHLQYEIDVEVSQRLLDAVIPTLVIQTFVENSIKYTDSTDGNVVVEVRAFLEYEVEGSYIHIIISDTGAGYREEVLEQLNNGKKVRDERGEHIGIYNVQQRLRLIYGDRAQLHFSNRATTGAKVEIRFPLLSDASSGTDGGGR